MVGLMVEAAQMASVLPNVLLLMEPFALIFNFRWSLKKEGLSVTLPVYRSALSVRSRPLWL